MVRVVLPVTESVEPREAAPVIVAAPLIVEDACETKPAVCVSSPVTPKVPPKSMLPVVVKFPTTVEEAWETKPAVRVESPVTPRVPAVERFDAAKVVPLKVRLVPLVICVPSK